MSADCDVYIITNDRSDHTMKMLTVPSLEYIIILIKQFGPTDESISLTYSYFTNTDNCFFSFPSYHFFLHYLLTIQIYN